MQGERGFTLLEILAALAIAIIGIAAVAKATSGAINVLQTAEDRVLASWVASNRLAELRIGRAWPGAITKHSSQQLGGRVWYVSEQISQTTDPDLLRVDLSVYIDQDQQRLGAKLFGYLARYSPPTEPPLAPDQSDQSEAEQLQEDSTALSEAEKAGTSQQQDQGEEQGAQQ